jgi:NADH dehydrogenase (ubiquinone) Fe-S protein 1
MLKIAKKFLQNPLITKSKSFFHTSAPNKALVEIFIDDKPVKIDSTYTIFQACHEAGVIIPRFCYHERLAVAGNCRMCLVEVEKSPKPVASCAMQVMPGMKVITKSEKTRIARGGVMEFLLANHPLDCPICDQGGECDLQDISQVYGYRQGRFMEYKRSVEDKNMGPLISTIMTRCIHCTRCVRFSEEIAGMPELGTSGRGKATEIGTYIEKMITSELSGNLVDVCPVGALTNGPYSFTSRPWELRSWEGIDVMDGMGSAMQVDTRGSEIMRILPRIHEEINEEWISDKGRFAFDGFKKQRLTVPLKREKDGNFSELSWEEALSESAKKLQSVSGEELAAVIGEFTDVETCVAVRDLMHRLDCENFEVRSQAPKFNPDFRASYLMNSKLTGVEEADLLLLVGTNPKHEAPVFNSRILRQTRYNNLKVAVIGSAIDLTYDYMHLGNSTKTLVEIAEGRHPFCTRLANAKLPMIIVGQHALERPDGKAILSAIASISENSPVINKKTGWNGFNVLHSDCTRVAALDLGLTTTTDLSKKKPKVILIVGADNNLRTEDIPSDAFVIYIGTHGDEGAYFADLILPGAGYTEKSTTFVNTEGRAQTSKIAVNPPGLGREDWKIVRALSEECGQTLPYDTIEEIRYRIAELAPHLLKYDYIEPTIFGDYAIKSLKNNDPINLTPITDAIDNYYMTDAVSRSSVTMAKCSTAFNRHKFSNFKV